jgi:hypothetical protein
LWCFHVYMYYGPKWFIPPLPLLASVDLCGAGQWIQGLRTTRLKGRKQGFGHSIEKIWGFPRWVKLVTVPLRDGEAYSCRFLQKFSTYRISEQWKLLSQWAPELVHWWCEVEGWLYCGKETSYPCSVFLWLSNLLLDSWLI